MHWNFRLIAHGDGDARWVGIHEVFYEADNSLMGYTADAVGVTGEDAKECHSYYIMMAEAFDKPVLKEDDFPEEHDIILGDASDDDPSK